MYLIKKNYTSKPYMGSGMSFLINEHVVFSGSNFGITFCSEIAVLKFLRESPVQNISLVPKTELKMKRNKGKNIIFPLF